MTASPVLRFRNLEVTPDDPVQEWGVEGLVTAIERGGLQHWSRIAAAIRIDPDGPVLLDLLEALEIAESPGTVAALRGVIARIQGAEAYDVAQRVRAAIRRSRLTAAQFAAVIGTSGSRLSTYANGTVTPSAALLQRIEHEARARAVLEMPGLQLDTSPG